jgi:transcriptional regulator with XRE-family HTH domain
MPVTKIYYGVTILSTYILTFLSLCFEVSGLLLYYLVNTYLKSFIVNIKQGMIKMTYSELLTKYIEKSGLSLGEIALRLKSKGVKVDRSYISKLKTGARDPASEEVNRALAEVIGGDVSELLLAGYIEKAPGKIRDLINGAASIDAMLDKYFDLVILSWPEPQKFLPDYSVGEDKQKYLSRLTIEQKLKLLESAISARNEVVHSGTNESLGTELISRYMIINKLRYIDELERELGIDFTDPEIQKKLKRAAKVFFTDED